MRKEVYADYQNGILYKVWSETIRIRTKTNTTNIWNGLTWDTKNSMGLDYKTMRVIDKKLITNIYVREKSSYIPMKCTDRSPPEAAPACWRQRADFRALHRVLRKWKDLWSVYELGIW